MWTRCSSVVVPTVCCGYLVSSAERSSLQHGALGSRTIEVQNSHAAVVGLVDIGA